MRIFRSGFRSQKPEARKVIIIFLISGFCLQVSGCYSTVQYYRRAEGYASEKINKGVNLALQCDDENKGKTYCDDSKTNREKGWLKPNGVPPTNPAYIDESEPIDIPPPAPKPVVIEEKPLPVVDLDKKPEPKKTVKKKVVKKKTATKSSKPMSARQRALARRKKAEELAKKKAAAEGKTTTETKKTTETKPADSNAPANIRPLMPKVSDDILTPVEE